MTFVFDKVKNSGGKFPLYLPFQNAKLENAGICVTKTATKIVLKRVTAILENATVVIKITTEPIAH